MKFELVQVHISGGAIAEVVIRDQDSWLVYAGNLRKVVDPKSYYPPDYTLQQEDSVDFCKCDAARIEHLEDTHCMKCQKIIDRSY